MSKLIGTNVIAPIVPRDTLDRYPTHKEEHGQGGYRTVDTFIERDSLPQERLKLGMLVNVLEDGKKYELISISNPLTNDNWLEFKTGTDAPIINALEDIQDVPTPEPAKFLYRTEENNYEWREPIAQDVNGGDSTTIFPDDLIEGGSSEQEVKTIKLRRDLAANWISNNPILEDGEFGFEKDTNKFKIGNGIDTWINLSYSPEVEVHEHLNKTALDTITQENIDTWNTPSVSRAVNLIDAAGDEISIQTPKPFAVIDQVDVWVNGIKLFRNSEYINSIANPGTYIDLSSALIAGDNIEIIVW